MNDEIELARLAEEYTRDARDAGLHVPTLVTRRRLLALIGTATVASALPFQAAEAATKKVVKKSTKKLATRKSTKNSGSAPTQLAATAGSSSGSGPRVLVVIELQGGNDGFSMLVPTGDARFRSLRDRAWLEAKHLKAVDDRYSIAAGLAPINSRLSFVEGVGVAKPDLSHTAMMTRWWQGDPDGTTTDRTGFLGRLCDALGQTSQSPIIGVGLGGGTTPALVSAQASTVSLPNLWSLTELVKDQDERMRPTLSSLAEGGAETAGLASASGELLAAARLGISGGLNLVGSLSGLSGKAAGYPDGELAGSLILARELISMNAGTRVLHVKWGSFDTHTGQTWSHPDQMRQLGAMLTAFHNDLVRHGLSNRVMVATTSEFGRRPQANAGGTDHGTASTMLLMGPQTPGRHGVAPDFGRLDSAGNVTAAVSMADYYATLASWVGVPASAVLKSGTPIASLNI